MLHKIDLQNRIMDRKRLCSQQPRPQGPGRFSLAKEVGREKAFPAPPPKPGKSALGTRLCSQAMEIFKI